MSIFQFKVSSLSKLEKNANSFPPENTVTGFTPPSTSSFSKPEPSPKNANISEFLLDENEMWNDDDSDIFKEKLSKLKEESLTDSKEELFKPNALREDEDIIGNNSIADSNESDTTNIEDEELKFDKADFDLTDSDFCIPANEQICFDLGAGSDDDIIQDENDSRSDNCASPTFKVCIKPSSKISSGSVQCKKGSPWVVNTSNIQNTKAESCNVKNNSNKEIENLPAKRTSDLQNIKIENYNAEKNVKSLGLAEETDAWLENLLQNEAFFNTSPDTSKTNLQNNLLFLNKSYVEILEKVMAAFEALPGDLLKQFPGFDPDVFMTLRTTRRRIKAIMIKTENLLKRKNMPQSTMENQNIIPQDKSNSSQFSYDGTQQKDFSRLHYSSDLNLTGVGKNFNKSTEGIFEFKQTSTVVNKPVPELSQARTSVSTPPKPSSSLNKSVIDYTDMLYKSPGKSQTPSNKGKFNSNMRNDGASGQFDGLNFTHSKELLDTFKRKFGLRSFRTNQLQVINAALLGNDCFVLMPTGGGKSLCYQLPAIITKGVTVVISPLRSLILDQVTKLLTLDIAAAHLSGDMKESEAGLIYRKLNQPEPSIKLLYVTPEKLGVSTSLKNCLLGLYKRGMLARFVIDEAHCVSQWGHDFRPDYKKLRELRENFPEVNIMALTATATPRVRTDILHQLKVMNPKWFLSSFNRSNLTYSVKEKKGKSALKEIAALIRKDFKKDTGVIYCFSRKECEDVAKDLKDYGITAIPYHAGLNDNDRTRAQNLWMNDKVKVVCATIAFGMGIDKLDVRFVIHFSLPKSIEGYYQESGRAGRDGEKATCILYYSYRDKIRMLKLINMDQSMANEQARKVHIDNLFRVVAFAENKTDCRRALQLEYFGEKFDRKTCIQNRSTACDNCLQQGVYETIDVTAESKAIVSAVKQVCGSDDARYSNYTMLHFVDVFKGTVVKKVLAEGHNNLSMYGMGKSWQRLDVERLFRKLIMEEFLKERLMVKDDGITFAYVKFGRRGEELLKGNIQIMFEVKKRKGSAAALIGNVKKEKAVDPAVLELEEKCYSDLMEVIHEIASSINCNPNAIMNVQAIRAMSSSLPETPDEMLSINHVTTANFEKYGNILLDVTKKYAAEKKALNVAPVIPEDISVEENWTTNISDDSPYFETDITFCGKNGPVGGGGRKRRRPNNFKKWQNSKKWKGSNNSNNKSHSSKSNTKGGSKSNANSSGVTTVSGAKISTLMELPTNKSRGFPRPKVLLKNL